MYEVHKVLISKKFHLTRSLCKPDCSAGNTDVTIARRETQRVLKKGDYISMMSSPVQIISMMSRPNPPDARSKVLQLLGRHIWVALLKPLVFLQVSEV